MKRFVACMVFLILLNGCEKRSASEQGKAEAPPPPKIIVEKEKIEKEPPPPPEVKIRLKRDGKDNYSWELSGSDVDQVLKVNEKLRRKLGEEPSR
jgi:hypothetical protein